MSLLRLARRFGSCAVAVPLLLVGFSMSRSPGAIQEDGEVNLATFDQVWATIRDRHFDPDLGGLDWEAVRDELRPLAAEAATTQELRGLLTQMLNLLGQSHLVILPGAAFPTAEGGANGSAPGNKAWDNGCGFRVRVVDGVPEVASVKRNSAVAAAGVEEGWRIRSVAGEELPETCAYTGDVNFPLVTADGKSVTVGFVNREGALVKVTIPLGNRRGRTYEFEGMPPIDVWIEHKWLDPAVGYISFNWFFDPVLVMTHFNRAMENFAEAEAVIIDIRGNGGGFAAMGAAMTAWFTEGEERRLGTVHSRGHSADVVVHPRPAPFGGRVAVLTDGGSGSAAEIFAAGMRDAAGARLFGQTTMGGVLPAAFDPLPNGDVLQYVVANYVTVKGTQLEGKGVVPDQETDVRRTADPFEDEAITAALDWIFQH